MLNTSHEHILRSDNKLIISIWGHEDLGVGSVFSILSSDEAMGKWLIIDSQGEISLPQLGRVKLDGLTIREASLYIESMYARFLKDPIVNLRVINIKVTVLGEVKTPGSYMLDKEKVNLVEIIGQAGGFTKDADVENIQILRGDIANPEEIYLDMTDLRSFSRNDLFLQSGDVIYVKPDKGKKAAEVSAKVAPYVGIVSGIAVVLSLLFNRN